MDEEAVLLQAYKSAVVNEAQRRGLPCEHFGEAMAALPVDVGRNLRRAYADQVAALRGRLEA